MKSITLKIKNGVPESIGVSGDYVRVKTASVAVRIQVESGDVDATIEQGDALNLKPFSRLIVSHADAAEQTVTLLIGDGTSADSAKVGGSVAVSGTVTTSEAGLCADLYSLNYGAAIGTNNSTIFTAKADRKFLAIQNRSVSATVFVRTGGGVILTDGFKLAPGQMLILDRVVPSGPINVNADAAGTSIWAVQA